MALYSAVAVGLFIVCAGFMWPVFRAARTDTDGSTCLRNVKELAFAMTSYASDHDDRLPLAQNWTDQIRMYPDSNRVFTCPILRAGAFGYAMSNAMSHVKQSEIDVPGEAWLLFESDILGKNAASGPESLPNPGRHHGRNVVGFADGHVKGVRSN